jgi:hypothetical protein
MELLLTSQASRLVQVSETLRERAYWARLAAELDEEFGTESVEAAMRAVATDPDAYLAARRSN